MVVLYSTKFKKQLAKAGPKIQKALIKRRQILEKDPNDHALNNHKLSGRYSGFRSINITGDWRAVFSEERTNNTHTIIFRELGTHSQLYR